MTPHAPLFALHDVYASLNLGRQFEALDWQINAGEHWAIVGGNGSGKTALLALLMQQIPLSAGRLHTTINTETDIAVVSMDEAQHLIDNDVRHDISEVCDNAMDAGTTLLQLLLDAGVDTHTAQITLDTLGIGELAARGVRYVSTGQMRRALMARALAGNYKVIALDNPLDGLDVLSRERIAAAIETLMTPERTTLYLSRDRRNLPQGITHVLELKDCAIAYAGTRDSWNPGSAPKTRTAVTWREIDTSAPPLVRFDNVDMRYDDKPIFQGATFSIQRFAHTLVSGPNGCGKSTLLALITGDNHKAYGKDIWLFDKRRGSGESVWDIKSRMGMVSTALHSNYPRGFNGLQVVLSGLFDSLGLYDNYGVREKNQALETLARFNLADLANTPFHRASYGQQRQLLLARAVIKNPPLLILDEACIGIDEEHRDLFLAQLADIMAHSDSTVLYVSHVADEVPAGMHQQLLFQPATGGGYDVATIVLQRPTQSPSSH